MPDIGADEVEVTEILVKVGDKVEAEQSLITVEGDKASMEVPAPFAGTVKEIKIATGDKVKTGSLIMVFEVAGAASAAAPAARRRRRCSACGLCGQRRRCAGYRRRRSRSDRSDG